MATKKKTPKPPTINPTPAPVAGFTSVALRPIFDQLQDMEMAVYLARKYTGFIPIDRITSMWYTWASSFENVCAKYSASAPPSLIGGSPPKCLSSVAQRIEEVRSDLPVWCSGFGIAVPSPQKGQVRIEG